MTTSKTSQETVIEPTRGWRVLKLREFWGFRDLLWLFVWRDFATRYKQTVLGPLWHLIQPLITTVVFTVVFSHVAAIPTDGLPPTLFYLCGLLPWNFFSQTFNSTSVTLTANANLFGKVYFPRLIVPVSTALSNLIAFLIQFASFLAIAALYRWSHEGCTFGARWESVFLPLILLDVAAVSLGVGLWISALTAKYRDIGVLSGFVIQLWMYATPVIYPLSNIPKQWRDIALINPMSMPVECFRYVLLGTGTITPGAVLISVIGTVLLFVLGLQVFQRVERNFVDIV